MPPRRDIGELIFKIARFAARRASPATRNSSWRMPPLQHVAEATVDLVVSRRLSTSSTIGELAAQLFAESRASASRSFARRRLER
jgi:hypothetical protein